VVTMNEAVIATAATLFWWRRLPEARSVAQTSSIRISSMGTPRLGRKVKGDWDIFQYPIEATRTPARSLGARQQARRPLAKTFEEVKNPRRCRSLWITAGAGVAPTKLGRGSFILLDAIGTGTVFEVHRLQSRLGGAVGQGCQGAPPRQDLGARGD